MWRRASYSLKGKVRCVPGRRAAARTTTARELEFRHTDVFGRLTIKKLNNRKDRGGQRTGRGPARPAPSAAAPVDPGRKPRGAGPGGNAAGKGSGGQPDPMKTSVGYIGHDAVARQRKADATRGKGAQPPRGGQGGGKRRGPGR